MLYGLPSGFLGKNQNYFISESVLNTPGQWFPNFSFHAAPEHHVAFCGTL
jgi:hypothetical protein